MTPKARHNGALRTAQEAAAGGDVRLTRREREVIRLMADGRTNKEIASVLSISVKTVQFHRGQIMRKLDLHSAVEVAVFALRHGLTEDEHLA